MRPSGTASRKRRSRCSSCHRAALNLVRTSPGQTALTRMPSRPHSWAMTFVKLIRAALRLAAADDDAGAALGQAAGDGGADAAAGPGDQGHPAGQFEEVAAI